MIASKICVLWRTFAYSQSTGCSFSNSRFSFSTTKFSWALVRALSTAVSLRTSIFSSLPASAAPSSVVSSEQERGTITTFGDCSLHFASSSLEDCLLILSSSCATRMIPSKCWACCLTFTTLEVSTPNSFCSFSCNWSSSPSYSTFRSLPWKPSPPLVSTVAISLPDNSCSCSSLGSTTGIWSFSSMRCFCRFTKPAAVLFFCLSSSHWSLVWSPASSIWYRNWSSLSTNWLSRATSPSLTSFSTPLSNCWSRGCIFPSIKSVWRLTKPFLGMFSVSCSLLLSSVASNMSDNFLPSTAGSTPIFASCATPRSGWSRSLSTSPSHCDTSLSLVISLSLPGSFTLSWHSSCSNGWSFPSINSVCRFTRPLAGISVVTSSLRVSLLSFDDSEISAFTGLIWSVDSTLGLKVLPTHISSGDVSQTSLFINSFPISLSSEPALSFSSWESRSFSDSCSGCCSFPSIRSVCRFTRPLCNRFSTSSPPSVSLTDVSATFVIFESLLKATSCLGSVDVPVTLELLHSSSCLSFIVLLSTMRVSLISSDGASSNTELSALASKGSFSTLFSASFICSPACWTNTLSSCSFFEAEILRADTVFFISSFTFWTSASTLTPWTRLHSSPSWNCNEDESLSATETPSISFPSWLTLFASSLPPRWSNARLVKLSRCFNSKPSLCFRTTPGSGSSLWIVCSSASSVILSLSSTAFESSTADSSCAAEPASSDNVTDGTKGTPSSNFLEWRFTKPLSTTPSKSLGKLPCGLFPRKLRSPMHSLFLLSSKLRISLFLRSNPFKFSSLADLTFASFWRSCNFLGPRSRKEHDLRNFPVDSLSNSCPLWSPFDKEGTELTRCNELFWTISETFKLPRTEFVPVGSSSPESTIKFEPKAVDGLGAGTISTSLPSCVVPSDVKTLSAFTIVASATLAIFSKGNAPSFKFESLSHSSEKLFWVTVTSCWTATFDCSSFFRFCTAPTALLHSSSASDENESCLKILL